jgi:hypothetical protein
MRTSVENFTSSLATRQMYPAHAHHVPRWLTIATIIRNKVNPPIAPRTTHPQFRSLHLGSGSLKHPSPLRDDEAAMSRRPSPNHASTTGKFLIAIAVLCAS